MTISYRSVFPFQVKITPERRKKYLAALYRKHKGDKKKANKELSEDTRLHKLEHGYISLVLVNVIKDPEVSKELDELGEEGLSAICTVFDMEYDGHSFGPKKLEDAGSIDSSVIYKDRPTLEQIYSELNSIESGFEKSPVQGLPKDDDGIRSKQNEPFMGPASGNKSKKERISLMIETSVIDAIKVIAEEEDRSYSYIVRQACKEYIKKRS